MRTASRSVLSAIVAVVAVVVMSCLQTVGAGAALAAGHLLVLGGNSNPTGVFMQQELNGYISGNPGTRYSGYDFQIVRWSAQTPFTQGSDGSSFDTSQAEGVGRVALAVSRNYKPGDKIVVVGYSSSASVVTKAIAALQSTRDAGESTPSPDDLSFVVFGNPTRPNGGLFARFPGFVIKPPLGVTFDGPAAPSDYQVTDISWQYDGFSDFPSNPGNVLAVANAIMGIFTLHGSYFDADPTDPTAILQDSTVGNTRYITLKADRLPLLAPLYAFIPPVFLGGLDAVLRAQIEKGYDRSVSAGVPVPATPILGVPAPTTTAASTTVARSSARAATDTSAVGPTTSPSTSVATTTESTATSSPTTGAGDSESSASTTPSKTSDTATTSAQPTTSAATTSTSSPAATPSATPPATTATRSTTDAATKTVAAVG